MDRQVRVGMVAGEASGDLLGAHLIAALRARVPGLSFFGIGGPRMLGQGFDSWFPQETLAVRGLVEVLRHLPRILSVRRSLVARMLAAPPDLFVGIDSPDFNLGLEQKLKRGGIPTAHYVSPTIWAWRPGRIEKIRRAVSHMLVLFPFEEKLYVDAGIPATFVGHPLADEIPLDSDPSAARAELRLPSSARVFALLPGSRQAELREHADLFVATAKLVAEREPAARFLVPLATRETRALFEAALYRSNAGQLPITLLFGHAHEAIAASDAALVASGTATLETALIGRPMVVTYRVHPVSFAVARRMVRVPYVALPNVLAGEFIVPEFLQDDATPENLAQALVNVVNDDYVRRALPERLSALHLRLRQGAAERAADALLPYLAGARPQALAA